MTETTPFTPKDIKKARFLIEFIKESEEILENLGLSQKHLELEKLTFLRTLLNNPSCTRKRRDEVDEQIQEAKQQFDDLKAQARTINNELEIFKRTYMALPEKLRDLAKNIPT